MAATTGPSAPGGQAPGAAETGVIHDIGYRHYDGPRLGRGYIARSLFLESWRGAFGLGRSTRSKVMPLILLGFASLPAIIITLVANTTGAKELPVKYVEYAPDLAILVFLFVAGQAPACVSRDLRYRVISLYFSRPMTRYDYVHAKIAALTSAIFVLLAIPLTLLYAGALLLKLPFWAQTRGYLEALAGDLVLALLLAVIGLVIAAVTPRRGVGVAAVITVLLVLSAVQGIVGGLAGIDNQQSLARYSAIMAPFRLTEELQAWVFRLPTSISNSPPTLTEGLVFLAATVVIVAACYGLLRLRYRKVAVS